MEGYRRMQNDLRTGATLSRRTTLLMLKKDEGGDGGGELEKSMGGFDQIENLHTEEGATSHMIYLAMEENYIALRQLLIRFKPDVLYRKWDLLRLICWSSNPLAPEVFDLVLEIIDLPGKVGTNCLPDISDQGGRRCGSKYEFEHSLWKMSLESPRPEMMFVVLDRINSRRLVIEASDWRIIFKRATGNIKRLLRDYRHLFCALDHMKLLQRFAEKGNLELFEEVLEILWSGNNRNFYPTRGQINEILQNYHRNGVPMYPDRIVERLCELLKIDHFYRFYFSRYGFSVDVDRKLRKVPYAILDKQGVYIVQKKAGTYMLLMGVLFGRRLEEKTKLGEDLMCNVLSFLDYKTPLSDYKRLIVFVNGLRQNKGEGGGGAG